MVVLSGNRKMGHQYGVESRSILVFGGIEDTLMPSLWYAIRAGKDRLENGLACKGSCAWNPIQ
jgi:hypothetical protein